MRQEPFDPDVLIGETITAYGLQYEVLDTEENELVARRTGLVPSEYEVRIPTALIREAPFETVED